MLGGAAVGTGFWLRLQWDLPGPLPEAKDVVVPHGGTAAAAAALKSAGVIDNATAFEALTWITFFDGNIHAAEFNFPPQATIADVLEVLRTAKPVEHKITIVEGLTAKQIAATADVGRGRHRPDRGPAGGQPLCRRPMSSNAA